MVIERKDAVAVLVSAFQDDPLSRWLFPDDATRPAATARLFEPFVARSAEVGELAVAGGGAAVAVWLPHAAGESGMDTGDEPPPEFLPYLARLRHFAELVGPLHPHGRAHLYLPFLGVAPGEQGRGLGAALLADRLALADEQGLPVYLEASSARSRPLYERHGFRGTGEPVTLPDGPRIWPMWREPVTDQGEQR
ncbi:GNAT family N-acetyltransferase [Prauserella cavernicola]|uniref:GNAT family N-acetyltransferase n=1 Tax=Prauserella cavernicola TaxID=2800127 RepID=A0A934V3S0_9PSEU|nr:GNAT family N-acetyltransferase [Prauserella cavernicola]MBK1783340.1 GNAT family N-acetyltransferase [Prauserella cavernicola]